jgi:hypothetical protein
MTSQLVEVDRFTSRIVADIVRARLEAAGIRAIVSADDCGGFRPELQFSLGASVLVAAHDLDRAREELAHDDSSNERDDA